MDVMTLYRAARWLHDRRLRFLSRALQASIRVVFAAHVPAEARIGEGTLLGYQGLGVVIHPRAVIGRNVLVGPGVTIGGRSQLEGVPVVEDDVFIGTGAKILGPVHVGRGSVIGANAVVIDDVAARSVVAGAPARVIRQDVDVREFGDLPDALRRKRTG